MESEKAVAAVCVDCYREHCRQQQQQPSAAVTDRRRSDRRGARRYDFAGRSSGIFIAGSFVIGLILVPCAMSAPVNRQQQQQHSGHNADGPTGTPFWYDPCGTGTGGPGAASVWYEPCGSGSASSPSYDGSGAGVFHDVGDEPMMGRSEADIVDGIITKFNSAMGHVVQFAEPFVQQAFTTNLLKHHKQTQNYQAPWLAKAKYSVKRLDVKLDPSYLKSLTLRSSLRSVYLDMQYLAVGMEQVVWDMRRNKQEFADDFKNATEIYLKNILCELSTAILDLNETPETVYRNVMPANARMQDNETRWLILREYMTGLQYAIEVFTHLKSLNR